MRIRDFLIPAIAALLSSGCGLFYYTPYKVAHMTPEELRTIPDAHLCAGAGRATSKTIQAEIDRRALLSDEDREHIALERVAVGMSRCALEIVMPRRHYMLVESTRDSTGLTRLTWQNEWGRVRKFYATIDSQQRVTEWSE